MSATTSDMTTPNPALGIDDAALEAARREIEAERADRAAAWAQADGRARACRAELRYVLDQRDGYGEFSDAAIVKIASELVAALDEVDRVEGVAR